MDMIQADIFGSIIRGKRAAQEEQIRAAKIEQMKMMAPLEQKLNQLKAQRLDRQLSGGGFEGSDIVKGTTQIVRLKDGTQAFATPITNKVTGKSEVSYAPIEGSFLDSYGQTKTEQMLNDALLAGNKAKSSGLGSEEAKIIGEEIRLGKAAAASVPVLKRTVDILNQLETGGFSAVKIRAKEFLGKESADEAELLFNMGKLVVSQLKDLFGGQFTLAEKESFDKINASLRRNTEANRRIIEQELRKFERTALKGQNAARRGGTSFDDDYDIIESDLNFDLTPPDQPQNTEPSGQPKRIKLDVSGEMTQPSQPNIMGGRRR